MTLLFDGNELENIIYNGNDVSKVIFNGNTVWEKSVEQDTESPVVTLIGGDVTIQRYSAFEDPGVTITDNSGEILTPKLTIYYSSNGPGRPFGGAPNGLDTSVLGTYAVWYSATDSSGNVSNSVRRFVNIIE